MSDIQVTLITGGHIFVVLAAIGIVAAVFALIRGDT